MNPVTGLLILAFLGTEKAPAPCAGCAAEQTWELTLAEAVHIGVGNAEVAQIRCERMEEDGQVYVTIAPASRAASPPQFKAEVMALVRSVEQQYWDLVQQHAQRHAAEGAVKTARDVLRREQAELNAGRGTAADVAEAKQRLEQFSLNLVTKTSDVITTERQLRNILGLPPADNRRIVPATKPVETEAKYEWDNCLAAMLSGQPDIVRQRTMLYASALQCLAARGPALVSLLLGCCPEDPAGTTDAQQASSSFRQQQEHFQQVVHQSTHSLARFFLEVDANYKQFKTASRLRAAAGQRLEAQRAFYEERRIPIDRYLDAVVQYASAVAQDAQFKTMYNVSLAALEEAKGTLLDYRKVTIEETPAAPAQVASAAPPRSLDPDVKPTGAQTNSPPTPARNVTFDITIGEARPIRVRGTISIGPGQ